MPPITIQVRDITLTIDSLSPQLDQAFEHLYTALLSGRTVDQATFSSAAITYLTSTTDLRAHDAYFNNFTPLWQLLLNNDRLNYAEQVWLLALQPALDVEATAHQHIHKGTAYYFQGMTALLADSLDRGYLLMHRALEEDVRTHESNAPSTPGYALVTLDDARPDQAFRAWVLEQSTAVEQHLQQYRSRYAKTLTLPELRRRFLAMPENREAAYLYSYVMAQVRRLLKLPSQLWEGPFAAQVAFSIIFDLCLVIDDAIHQKNLLQWKFIDHATMLSQRSQLGLTRATLEAVNGLFREDFSTSLRAGLGDTLSVAGQLPLTGLAASLAITYGCRNRGAHNVAAVSLNPKEFNALVGRLNEILFLTVEILY